MIYTAAKRAEYPAQDEAQLLIDFTAELLARRKFAETGDIGESWNDWIGNRAETREERMEPFVAHAASLSALGMLTWPVIETMGIGWVVEGPGQMRGLKAAPALDWITTFGREAAKAVAYFRACNLTGQPCRLQWSFGPRDGANRA